MSEGSPALLVAVTAAVGWVVQLAGADVLAQDLAFRCLTCWVI